MGAIVAIGGGTFAAASVGLAVASAFTVGAYGLALNAVMKALGPKKPKGAGRGLDQQMYDAVAGGRILFGQVRVSGAHLIPPIVTANVEVGGSKPGMRSHRLLALAIHEVDSFVTTYGDQTEITNAQIHAVSGTASTDGRVESGKWAPNGTSTTYLWIRRYVGSATQTTDAFLAAVDGTAFSTDFRGRGICYAAITYGWSGSGSSYLWQTGLPDFTFVIKGMKVYDPRLDSTNGGTGTQRYATPSTWTWSANPALIAGTFLMFDELRGGGGYDPATEIDWSLIAAAATICDANVDSISGSANRDRYTCNLVLEATAGFEDNLSDIIDCMTGRCVWRDGKWRVYAGAYDTPTSTINKEDWISPLTIQTIAPRREGRWNGVKCFYVDPSRNYQRVECYPRTNTTYYEDDASERIWLEIERAGCNNESEAQMHAEFILRQSRNQIKVTGRLGPRFQYLSLWETVYINHADLGWSSKSFRIITYKLNPDGSVDIGLSEEQSTDWTDLATSEFNSPSTAAIPTSDLPTPSEPTNFTVTVVGNTVVADWADSEVFPPRSQYELWQYPGSLSIPESKQLIWRGDASQKTLVYTTNTPQWLQVRASCGSDTASAYMPNTYGVGVVPVIAQVFSTGGWTFQVSPTALYKQGPGSQVTTNPAAGIITNSAGTSVFSWTNPGSANIKISYPGSVATTFVGSGLAIDENRAGTFWLNVVDGANISSKSVSVSVTRLSGA